MPINFRFANAIHLTQRTEYIGSGSETCCRAVRQHFSQGMQMYRMRVAAQSRLPLLIFASLRGAARQRSGRLRGLRQMRDRRVDDSEYKHASGWLTLTARNRGEQAGAQRWGRGADGRGWSESTGRPSERAAERSEYWLDRHELRLAERSASSAWLHATSRRSLSPPRSRMFPALPVCVCGVTFVLRRVCC